MLNDGTWSYTWQHGRQLASMTKSGTKISYTYNSDGMRTSKTVNGTTTKYLYNDSQLVAMDTEFGPAYFHYDGTGVMAMEIQGTMLYYVKNAQGDVVALVDTNGYPVVQYTYDAWGNITDTTGLYATTYGQYNPFRYRGYIYDSETGLYCLSSRYYSPKICRFINADDISLLGANGDFTSYNLFAYCGNNPVKRIDSNGYFWNTIIGAIAGAVVGGITAACMGTDVAAGMLSGALSGAISGAAIDITIATGGAGLAAFAIVTGTSGIGGSVSSYVNQRMNGTSRDKIDWAAVAVDGVWGAVGGALSFGLADVGGSTCNTMKKIFAQSGKDIVKQAATDLGYSLLVTVGTWLNGTRMIKYLRGNLRPTRVYNNSSSRFIKSSRRYRYAKVSRF